eukprot:CAMPEP_0174831182 /NCGR_PEP_ID=MMETSP1114-20130205/2955_1 /TAXON_ID=312471 /ORGANISM="Neobodo designis, Strain CCAP 1951/1" /LENGTH=599 /DNA_ID=CAMNT_0016065003 /DNA_START=139 /DNA_END=1938 /DNA_ORIENTATION=-
MRRQSPQKSTRPGAAPPAPPRTSGIATLPGSQHPLRNHHHHASEGRRSTHVGTALLLLATCVRSIAPMGPMVPGSEVGFTTASHGPAGRAGPGPSGPSGHSGSTGGGAGATPNIAHAYALLHDMGSGAGAVPQIDPRRASSLDVGPCGTDASFTTTTPGFDAAFDADLDGFDANAHGHSNSGPQSDPPRVRTTYNTFGGGGSGGQAAMTDDAVELASDDDEEDELTPAQREHRMKARRAAEAAEMSSAVATPSAVDIVEGSDPDALSIESSPRSQSFASATPPGHVGGDSFVGSQQSVSPAAAATVAFAAAATTASNKKPLAAGRSQTSVAALPRACLDQVFANLSLADVEAARAAGPAFAAAADRVAPRPIDGMTFVRWSPQALRTSSLMSAVNPPKSRGRAGRKAKAPVVAATVPFHWRCLACSALTDGNKTCGECGSESSMTACRVFVGQLRKQHTAELLSHLIGLVCPDAKVLHIESHTNGHTGRSKGCAWVYLDSTRDAVALTAALHRRAFVDVDAAGNEGVWYTDGAAMEDALANFAAERVDAATFAPSQGADDTAAMPAGMRCPQLMPRQPVVAELPGKSLLAELALDAFDA